MNYFFLILTLAILSTFTSQPTNRSAFNNRQLPIPQFLQDIVQTVQSGTFIDATNLPPFIAAFVNQLQTGNLPPMLQSKNIFAKMHLHKVKF